jgi:hypothetical protein
MVIALTVAVPMLVLWRVTMSVIIAMVIIAMVMVRWCGRVYPQAIPLIVVVVGWSRIGLAVGGIFRRLGCWWVGLAGSGPA